MKYLGIISILLIRFSLSAQMVQVTGRAYVYGDITPNEARKEALNDAKLNALRKAGIPETISNSQLLTTNQEQQDFNQSFNSNLYSNISGSVEYDSVVGEKMFMDSTNHIVYEVTINAMVTQNAGTVSNKVVRDDKKDNSYYTYPNGDKYAGQWYNGKRDGYGTYWFANGAVYQGNYKEGLRNGTGKYWNRKGNYFTGSWTNGVYDGGGYNKNSYSCSVKPTQTNSSYSNANANNANTTPVITPQDKLSNDQANFGNDVENEVKKINSNQDSPQP